MNDSSVLDTPRKKQKSSILSKIFNQLTIQNEDIEASIEQKTRLIESYEAYPQKLETYVGNYILPERQMIVDAAEASLRDFLKPIEKRQRQLSSAQSQRELELKEAQKQKQAELELCQHAEKKNQTALLQLQSIIGIVESKLESMEKEGYPLG